MEQYSGTLMNKNAVVLLSGGMDSATVLAMARAQGYVCYALSVDYGQRHHSELAAAQRVAQMLGAHEHRVVNIDLTGFGGSSLTDDKIAVSQQPTEGIPLTYVPARNTIMLSLALAWAEVLHAQDIFIGVNAVDYSGYPDCRPAYVEAFERMANLATKAAVEGHTLTVHAPWQKSCARVMRWVLILLRPFHATRPMNRDVPVVYAMLAVCAEPVLLQPV
jgi:7-cyano-7-deazaguanine synthase